MAEDRRAPRDFDWILLGSVVALCAIGIAFINSAKATDGFSPFATRQVLAFALGMATLVFIRRIDYHRLVGTALTFLPLLAAVAFVNGIRWRWIILVLVTLAALAPVGWSRLKPYQRERVRVTLDPSRDPSGKGYQTNQSIIAVGSGCLVGQG